MLASFTTSCERGSYTLVSEGGGTAGAGSVGGSAGSVGTAGLAGIPGIMLPTPTQPCQVAEGAIHVFAGRGISGESPARRELFTWTTTEQAAEIRAGSVLLTRTEREGMGPGFAMQALAAVAATQSDLAQEQERIELAKLLSGPEFAKARYAWTEPWATRVGWPGEDYGDQLVRILLREEAFLARFQRGTLDVVDMSNAPVAMAEVLAHPERIAGVYFVKDYAQGGPNCGGSFFGGQPGYREYIIGNEAMIQEWSLGTPELRARLESDIALVKELFDRIRPCPSNQDPETWNISVGCDWNTGTAPISELEAYEMALAIPSENYLPSTQHLVTLIETLEASLFEPDPFIVEPGPGP